MATGSVTTLPRGRKSKNEGRSTPFNKVHNPKRIDRNAPTKDRLTASRKYNNYVGENLLTEGYNLPTAELIKYKSDLQKSTEIYQNEIGIKKEKFRKDLAIKKRDEQHPDYARGIRYNIERFYMAYVLTMGYANASITRLISSVPENHPEYEHLKELIVIRLENMFKKHSSIIREIHIELGEHPYFFCNHRGNKATTMSISIRPYYLYDSIFRDCHNKLWSKLVPYYGPYFRTCLKYKVPIVFP